MLTPADFINVPYTPDLTDGGVTYAVRSLQYLYDRLGHSPFHTLRRVVAGTAIELAFRRHLSQQDIPYDVKAAAPFTEPGRYDVMLGGHRCMIQALFVSEREQMRALQAQPNLLINALALVPSDQHAADGHRADDLYIFAYFPDLTADSQEELERVLETTKSAYTYHIFSRRWALPIAWRSLKPLALKSDSNDTLTVEIGGQAESREFLTHTIELPPRKRIQVDVDFFSLSFLHVKKLSGARIGIHSPVMDKPYIITKGDWGNLWVNGAQIILTGYMPYDEFSRRSSQIKPGSHIFKSTIAETKSLGVPFSDLKPLPDLFERVRTWEAEKRRAMRD